jgi:hypothetical protein
MSDTETPKTPRRRSRSENRSFHQETLRRTKRLLAQNPTLSNEELAKILKVGKNSYLREFAKARDIVGITSMRQASNGMRIQIDIAVYYPACKDLGVRAVAIPEDGYLIRHKTALVIKNFPNTALAPKNFPNSGRFRNILVYMAHNPGASNKKIIEACPEASSPLINSARVVLGYARGGGAERGYTVIRQVYMDACKQHNIEPLSLPSAPRIFYSSLRDKIGPDTPRDNVRFASTIQTVPTAEVPSEVLADTPRELRPATPEEKPETVIAQEGNDQYAQLRALVTLLRTEMAKRGIDTVRIEPGGVTVRRTVVVEEPFI